MSSKMSEQEFNIKFEKYSQMIFNIAFTYLRCNAIAEDIVQETFMKYLKHYKEFAENDQFERNWLIRVTINHAKDILRKNSRITRLDDEHMNCILANQGSSRLEYVNDLVCLLEEKYKIVLVLYYYENMSINEIAKVLTISVSAVKMRLKRAKDQLREMEEKNDYR